MNKVDLLVAEIGSTTTVVSAFQGIGGQTPTLLGQGQAPTTVDRGDVNLGLEQALAELREELGVSSLEWEEFFATSSAAGGLKMTVHGLVYDMTVKAAREAALGAGAVIRQVTAGRLRPSKLEKIKALEPNIILLAGGVDYGEEEVILHNARLLAQLKEPVPVIYAGNVAIKEEIQEIFSAGEMELMVVDNVYPEVDQFNIKPTREAIQRVFEKHIIKAPGLGGITGLVDGSIMPTPGAVMAAAELLREEMGDLVAVDVGGATTDVHSVADLSPGMEGMVLTPEPVSKRTVEGDLGVFINAGNVVEMLGRERMEEELGFSLPPVLEDLSPLPRNEREEGLLNYITREVVRIALTRHAGSYRRIYSPGGIKHMVEGKDLTGVKWIIGTGGVLSQSPAAREVLKLIRDADQSLLLPPEEARVLIDSQYIMAVTGVMSSKYPEAALKLLQESLL